MTTSSAKRQSSTYETGLNHNARFAHDGAPYYRANPIITMDSTPGAFGVMALDRGGMDRRGLLRVIYDRRFNHYHLDTDGTLKGSYERGFTDHSAIYHASAELLEDGSERWVVGDQVAIAGLSKYVEEIQNRLMHLRPSDTLLTSEKMLELSPDDSPSVEIDKEGVMWLPLPDVELANEKIINHGHSMAKIRDGIIQLLATAKLGENIYLGPEDPTVAQLDDGTICVFITVAVQEGTQGSRFETLMLKGTSIHDLEAIGFVPLGMMKEMCFGPVYHTEKGDARMVLGEGSLTGYSTIRAATVGADFALDSFINPGLVSLFPPNIHDRFAEYYDGFGTTPENEKYRWVGEHASVFNRVIDHDTIPLSDGWYVVMASGRSRGTEKKNADGSLESAMGPFEVGPMVVQLNPDHKYAGQCLWIDDRPLFHLDGAESITFGSDWYIKQDETTGLDRMIVFIVHRDDKDVCAVEMPLRTVWNRLPKFLQESDEAAIAKAANAVIKPHIPLNIQKRYGE